MAAAVQPLRLAQSLSFPQRQLLWLMSVLAGGLFVWAQRGRVPGAARLAAAAPLLVLNALAPLLFDGDTEAITNISVFITTASISNFKARCWRSLPGAPAGGLGAACGRPRRAAMGRVR